jgi:hypothetical protein
MRASEPFDADQASADLAPARLGLDSATVVAGVVLPLAGLAVDHFALGQGILSYAPAGLLTAMALGVAALLLTARLRPQTSAMAFGAGVLVAASVAAACVALPLALVSAFGGYFVLNGVGGRFEIMLVALGLGTLWTAWVFVRRAGRAIAASTGGGSSALVAGLSGALLFAALAIAADLGERAWLSAKLTAITRDTPEQWPGVFDRLSTYPLCGKLRCRELVCDQIYETFGERMTGGNYPVPAVPEAHEAVLAGYLGQATAKRCARPKW